MSVNHDFVLGLAFARSTLTDKPPASGRPLAMNSLTRMFAAHSRARRLHFLVDGNPSLPAYLKGAALSTQLSLGDCSAASVGQCDAIVSVEVGVPLPAPAHVPCLTRWGGIWPEQAGQLVPGLLGLRPFDCVVFQSRASMATATHAVSELNAALAEFSPTGAPALDHQLALIPLPVDTDRFCPTSDKLRGRAQFGLRADADLVLLMSRITPNVKADLVPYIRALGTLDLRKYARPVEVALAGPYSAAYGEVLTQAIAQAGLTGIVRLLGEVDPSVRHELIACADVGIIASDFLAEGLGNGPLEFLASGLPVVCAAWDGYRDTVVDGVTGFWIPTHWAPWESDLVGLSLLGEPQEGPARLIGSQCVATDLDAFCRHLDSLLSHRELRHEMGEASRRRAVEFHRPQVIVGKWEDLARDLSERARAAPRVLAGTAAGAVVNALSAGHINASRHWDAARVEFTVFDEEELALIDVSVLCPGAPPELMMVLLDLAQSADIISVTELRAAAQTQTGASDHALRVAVLQLLHLGYLSLVRDD